MVSYFAAVEKVYLLRDRVEDALVQHPWPESSARNQAAITERGAPQAATGIIPLELAAQLCRAAETVLNQAEEYLDAQEKCERIDVDYRHYCDDPILKRKNAYLKSVGLPSRQGFRKRLLDIPTAAYLLLGLLTGMRNHELASLEVGAYYESELGGETYGWLRGTSLKTGEGRTEWMVPLDIGRKIIAILERYSTLFRAKLSDQLIEVEAAMGNVDAGQMPALVKEHARLRAEQRRLFLTTYMTDSNRIGSPSNVTWNGRLAVFAEKHGIDWVPKTHQLRRTFAALAVSTGFGDLRYLREHFKHRSLDMTLLYAVNPQQDPELLGEITFAAERHRREMIERWLDDDSLLAGGGGKTITEQRGEFLGLTTSQRRKVIDDTAQNTFIRGTGHAWCLAETMGCGGHGLYDALRCGGCTHGVIDESVADVWRGIGRQQLELRDLSDIGPSGQQKVETNIRIVNDVLSDLGIHLDALSAYPQDGRRNDGQG